LACEYLSEQVVKYPHFYITKKVCDSYSPSWKVIYFEAVVLPHIKYSCRASWFWFFFWLLSDKCAVEVCWSLSSVLCIRSRQWLNRDRFLPSINAFVVLLFKSVVAFKCTKSFVKQQFVLSHTVGQIQMPALLDSQVKNTSVNTLCPRQKKKNDCQYSFFKKSCLSVGPLRIFSSFLCLL
jgi:hypothetical protein